MTIKELKEALESKGFNVAYKVFATPQALPYVVFYAPNETLTGSDERNHIDNINFVIELYTAKKDLSSESLIDEILEGFEYNKNEAFLTDEKCFLESFEFVGINKIGE